MAVPDRGANLMRLILSLVLLAGAATNASGQGVDPPTRTAAAVFVAAPIPQVLAVERQHEEQIAAVVAGRDKDRGYPRWLFPGMGAGLGVTAATYHALTTDADYYSGFSWVYESVLFGGAGALTGWIVDWLIEDSKKR